MQITHNKIDGIIQTNVYLHSSDEITYEEKLKLKEKYGHVAFFIDGTEPELPTIIKALHNSI